MSGAPKMSSISFITCGGMDDDDERMKRSWFASIASALRPAREAIA